MPEIPTWLTFVASAVIGAFLRDGLRWIVEWRRVKNEADHDAAASTATTLQFTNEMVQEWMRSADVATKELLIARRQIVLAENALRDGLRIMRIAELPQADEFERRILTILQVG